MKKLFYAVSLAGFLLTSCDKKESNQTAPDEQSVQTAAAPEGKGLAETAAILDGPWIAKDYLDNLKKSKTVYDNPEYTTTVFGMSFIKDSLATGSSLLYGFSPHEVTYSWPVYWNKANNRFEYDPKQDIGDRPLGEFYLTTTGNTLLELHFTESGKKEVYQKADIEEELNKLFEGTYTDAATGNEITFTRNGEVKGLPGFVQYYVQFDPDAEESVPFDAVFLYVKTTDEAGQPFHFKIKDKKLTLYHVNENEIEKYVEYTYTIGSEAFVLNRK